MLLVKSPATALLPHMDVAVSHSMMDLVRNTGWPYHTVKKWMQHLLKEGAVIDIGPRAIKPDAPAGGKAHYYLKVSGVIVQDEMEGVIEDWVLDAVWQTTTRTPKNATTIAEETGLSNTQITGAIHSLLAKGEIEKVSGRSYRAAKLRGAPKVVQPWDWRNFRTEHSPSWHNMGETSSYKSLPKGIDL